MNNFESKSFEKKEKPEVLYVAAHTPNLEELKPMEGRSRGGNEGAIIFSTPDKALASAFLVEGHSDDWMTIGYYSDIPCVVICMDRDEFVTRDTGGVMYEVSSDTFDYNSNLGMGDKEWTSSEPVKPTKETYYQSALDTMIENGVNVYFVDRDTFSKINSADDYGLSILLSRESENHKRNKVIKPLESLV